MTAICDDLWAFVDGELEALRVEAFNVHLVGCSTCAEALVVALQLDARLSELGDRSLRSPVVTWCRVCGWDHEAVRLLRVAVWQHAGAECMRLRYRISDRLPVGDGRLR